MKNTLHWKISGQGNPLILIHGWGMNASIWDTIANIFATSFQVYAVDLPGHGYSSAYHAQNIEEITQQLIVDAPKDAIWLGWSLGGLIATHIALHHPDYVKKLITVATSPKFSAHNKPEQWHGIEANVLTHFTKKLIVDRQKTIEDFITLQCMGSPTKRNDIKQLKQVMQSRPLANLDALLIGLKILSNMDIRSQLAQISMPTLSLFGHFDRLVPIEVAQDMPELSTNLETVTFMQSSHVPFISEAEMFCAQVLHFANK